MEYWSILLAFLAGALGIYYFCFRGLDYFQKTDLPYIPPVPIFGNMAPSMLRQIPMPDLIARIYNLDPEAKYVGFFDMMAPVIVIRDPNLIKSIAIKNFESFPNHRGFIDEVQDPLFGKNLFSLRDDRWKDVRNLLSPAFTSSKMKGMFKLMSDCAADFASFLSKMPDAQKEMEMKNAFTRYTNDVIATCAFGISIDSMRNPTNEFYMLGKEATSFDGIRSLKFFLVRSFPLISRLMKIKLINDKVAHFFKDLIQSTIQTRDQQQIYRPDMLQLMMETRGKRGEGRELTIDDMTSQAFIFFFGGFDTSSTAMCFAAHEIAANPHVQEKLRNEIDRVVKETNGELTYEALHGMEYLDAVLNEALRLYPIAVFLDRMCSKSFELPPSVPGAKPFTVKKGMNVWFPVYGLHLDEQYFEKPEKFDPDRFTGENKKNLNSPAFMPFGLGPRMCIGNRFALMEAKIVLFHLIKQCELKPCKKTVIPLQLNRKGINMTAEDGFWMKVQPRSDIKISNGTATANGKMANGKAANGISR